MGWLGARVSRTAVSTGLIVAGGVVSAALVLVFALTGPDPRTGVVGLIVVAEVGYVLVALGFLWVTGRRFAYLDLPRPTVRHVWYGLVGAAALVVSRQVVVVLFELAGVATTTGLTLDRFPVEVVDAIEAVLPALVVVSVLVIGPAEELLFRNVVQKYLGETFSTWGAIAVTSVLFALAHAPNYVAVPSGTPLAVGLAATFVISVVLGWLYARTGTLLAPIVAHGVYDAALFAGAYLRLAGLVTPG